MTGKVAGQISQVLIPSDIVVQHAGSIGYFSVGAGYELFKNKRGTLDFHYGHVPEGKGGSLHILSAKFAYRPFEVKVNEHVSVYPFNPGAFVSYHFGKAFDFYWDKSQYEDGYYWWSSAIRPHLSVSNEVKLTGQKLLRSLRVKAMTIYSEFNTNELYLVSFYQNPGDLALTDIIKIGLGVRLKF
ncbi:hypothetical protein [Arcticibacter sp. MXS-1]|uniref:hypothetical protein n=1 Tax=Arcticibacter sp. MXS-1 TaxID=3341726 RepID=UPI0035A92635